MLKRFLAAFLVFGLFVGGLFAVEGVIVKREKGSLTVKVGTEEKLFKLEKGVKIIDTDGTELKGKESRRKLKEGVKVDIKEKDGKVEEIKIRGQSFVQPAPSERREGISRRGCRLNEHFAIVRQQASDQQYLAAG